MPVNLQIKTMYILIPTLLVQYHAYLFALARKKATSDTTQQQPTELIKMLHDTPYW